MLKITIPGEEHYTEEDGFWTTDDLDLELEHSLISLSKWESIHQKPFLGTDDRTPDEMLDYIKAMVLTPDYPSDIFTRLTKKNFDKINEYIQSPESATTFHTMYERPSKPVIITSELIYFWLVAFNIPFEVENWHLNRLMALVRICNAKNPNNPQKKMSRHELAQRNRDLNAKRRAETGSRG